MDYDNLSKEELIQVLNEVTKAYEALKELYEKDTLLFKEVEERISRSEEIFKKSFQTSPDSICINRLSDGLYILINESFTKITGYTEKEVLGKSSLELNIWHDPERRNDLIKELGESGKVENFEAIFRKKDGSLIHGLMSATIIELGGEPHMLNITKDISSIKKIEEELENERNLLRTLIDNIPDRIFIKDLKSRFVICNKALIERFGKKDISEVKGKSDFDFQPRILAEKFYNDEQEIIRTGQPLINHEEPRVLGEEQRWNLITKVPLRDSQGNIIGIVGIAKDITEIKRQETERKVLYEIIKGISTTANLDELLKLIHESLKKIVYAENCFVALIDRETGEFYFPYFIDKYDSVPQKFKVNKSLTSYVFKTNEPFLLTEDKFNKLIDSGKVELIGTPSKSWVGIPLRTPEGSIGVLVLQYYERKDAYSQHDIDFLTSIGSQIAFAIERKKAEEEIMLKNSLLKKSNAEKDKFFSIIAHDLRGPLSAFMEATKILTEEIQDMSYDEIREISKELNKEASSIYALLENLLEWSRLQRGVLMFELKNVKLLELVGTTIEPLRAAAARKNIEIELNIPADAEVEADIHMIETVIRNLVSNAIKFTTEGKITVSAEKYDERFIKVGIMDTGIGIPPELIPHLFSLTGNVKRPGTEGEPSSGLGLLLCKEFVEKHGGKIWVESEEGKGSIFSFTIPGKIF